MRRRREAQSSEIPAHLVTFRRSDWSGDVMDRWRAWHRARRDHFEAVPEAWGGVPELLADSYAVRAELVRAGR